MKRNFDSVLKDVFGDNLKKGSPRYKVNEGGQPLFHTEDVIVDGKVVNEAGTPQILSEAPDMTLKDVAIQVLGATLKGDENMEGAKKMELYTLASKIAKGGIVNISIDESKTLKERIGRGCPQFIVGAAFSVLETDYVEPHADKPQAD